MSNVLTGGNARTLECATIQKLPCVSTYPPPSTRTRPVLYNTCTVRVWGMGINSNFLNMYCTITNYDTIYDILYAERYTIRCMEYRYSSTGKLKIFWRYTIAAQTSLYSVQRTVQASESCGFPGAASVNLQLSMTCPASALHSVR